MDIEETRRYLLWQVINSRFDGNEGACADAAGVTRPNLNWMLSGKKSFGEKVARKIESRLNLPHLLLDGLGAEQLALAQAIACLPADRQLVLRHYIEVETAAAVHAARKTPLLKLSPSREPDEGAA